MTNKERRQKKETALDCGNEPSAGYILAGLCSFICPGLGQLLLNRISSAVGLLLAEVVLWAVLIPSLGQRSDLPFFLLISLLVLRVTSAYFASNGHKIHFEESAPTTTEDITRDKELEQSVEITGVSTENPFPLIVSVAVWFGLIALVLVSQCSKL